MSISYQPKQAQVQSVQLKVQQLVLTLSDTEVVTKAASPSTDVTINIGEVIQEVRAALFCNDSAPAVELVDKANIDLAVAKKITLTLSEEMTADDSLIIDYVVSET